MIPVDIPIGSTYSIYWVWDWPTIPGVDVAEGKDEYYTTCSDIDIVINPAAGPRNPLLQQDLQTAAVVDFKSRVTERVGC